MRIFSTSPGRSGVFWPVHPAVIAVLIRFEPYEQQEGRSEILRADLISFGGK
jgi:hypothetical protein